jgi:hypothetical protein
MSLLDDIHAKYEEVVTAIESRFGPTVGADARALLAQAKQQAGAVLDQAGADVKSDVETTAGDVSQVASDAVPPAPAPEPPTS